MPGRQVTVSKGIRRGRVVDMAADAPHGDRREAAVVWKWVGGTS